MKMRRFALFPVVVLAAFASTACQSAPGEGAYPEPQDPPSVVETPTSTIYRESAPAPPEPHYNDTDDIMRLSANTVWDTAITAGSRITITFQGGDPGDFDSLCNWDYRLDVSEQDRRVEIGVVGTRILAPDVFTRDCPAQDQPWALTTTLAEPLGARSVIDSTSGQAVMAVALEARLMPTALPEGWFAQYASELFPVRWMKFANEDGTQVIRVVAQPITNGRRVSSLRRLEGAEPTTIRGVDDGVFAVNFDRMTTVGFEEQGWYYWMHADSAVDPVVVLNFARSFERLSLLEEPLADNFTPATTVPPQPGQEEREGQALQGVLPDAE